MKSQLDKSKIRTWGFLELNREHSSAMIVNGAIKAKVGRWRRKKLDGTRRSSEFVLLELFHSNSTQFIFMF